MTQDTTTVAADTITERVRERYAQAAQRVQAGGGGCCSSVSADDLITHGLYDGAETEGLPEEAVLASLGCGNPTAVAELREGERVLSLVTRVPPIASGDPLARGAGGRQLPVLQTR